MNSQENMLKHKHTNAFLNNYETNSKKVDNINNFLEKETTNSIIIKKQAYLLWKKYW